MVMNDKSKKEGSLNARRSLCWKCKHGLCVLETEQERVVHTNMHLLDGPPQPGIPDDDPFGIKDQMPYKEPSELDEGGGLVEHTIEHSRVKTVCYWTPESVTESPPIGMCNVRQCSRFEEK